MYTIISEAQPLCDGMYMADVLKDERWGYIYFAVEVTIEGVQKVFIVDSDSIVEFFSKGVNYAVMNKASDYTFENYEQFCKWCSYNLTN